MPMAPVGRTRLLVAGLLAILLSTPTSARVGDGCLHLRWLGEGDGEPDSPSGGQNVVVPLPRAERGWSLFLTGSGVRVEVPFTELGDGGFPKGATTIRGLAPGSYQLALRDAGGTTKRTYALSIAPELTTEAILDLRAVRLEVQPVHTEPFGNWQEWNTRELSRLPGIGEDALVALVGPGELEGRPGSTLNGYDTRQPGQLRPGHLRIDQALVHAARPLGGVSAALDDERHWIETTRSIAAPSLSVGMLASGGSSTRNSGQLGISIGRDRERLPGILRPLGDIEAAFVLQGLTYENAGPASVTEDELRHNQMDEVSALLSLTARPGGGSGAVEVDAARGLLRVGLAATGFRREHYLQEFRLALNHAPREERGQVQLSTDYGFGLSESRFSAAVLFHRTLLETGDGAAYDLLTDYDAVDGNQRVDDRNLYWAGDRAVSPFDEAHLFDYYQRDFASEWTLRLCGETPFGALGSEPLRYGVEGRRSSWRYYENLRPSISFRGVEGGGYEFASYLGYSADGNEQADERTHEARHPEQLRAWVSRRFEIQRASLEAGFRAERVTRDQDRLARLDHILADDDNLGPEHVRSTDAMNGIEPRFGLYLPAGRGHLWLDLTETRSEPPFTALYYSPNLVQALAYRAIEEPIDETRGFVFGNPSLEPEATRTMHLGFFRTFRDRVSLRMGGRFAATRDCWVARLHPQGVDSLAFYENRGDRREFGTTLDLRLRRGAAGQIRLLYDLTRRETNVIEPEPLYRGVLDPSAPIENASVHESGAPAVWSLDDGRARDYFPSLLDRTHRVALMVESRIPVGSAFGALLPDFDLTLLARAASGLPYTRTYVRREASADSRSHAAVPVFSDEINGERMPWTWQLDLGLGRELQIFERPMGFYLEARNLTNHRNVRRVYTATGEADDDGWLASPDGQAEVAARGGESFASDYRDRIDNPRNYDDGITIRARLTYTY